MWIPTASVIRSAFFMSSVSTSFSSFSTSDASSFVSSPSYQAPQVVDSSSSSSCSYDPHWALYPRTYVARRIPNNSIRTINGNLDKYPWNNDTILPWSEPFHDIQGDDGRRTFSADSTSTSTIPPPPRTRFKAVYDEEYLYIAATLPPAPHLITQAHFQHRNQPIYRRDSDYEVFVDPIGSNHNYKELEINAINTVWNLLLNKPYNDGGCEHSGRIAQPGDGLYWDVKHQRTATRVVHGQLNDIRHHQGAHWTVEVALSFRDLLDRCETHDNNGDGDLTSTQPTPRLLPPPTVGSFYRINFSRVEEQGKINWTWQAQKVWDPIVRKHVGMINMHLPDAWGYVVFGNELTKDASRDMTTDTHFKALRDPTWPHRLAAMNVYYALHHYKDERGSFTTNLQDLSVDQTIVKPFHVTISLSSVDNKSGSNNNDTTTTSFLVTIRGIVDCIVVNVRDDRLLQVTMQHKGVFGTSTDLRG